MKSAQRIISGFVERGLKEDIVSHAVRETSSYFEKLGLLYRYTNKKGPVRSTGHMNPEIMVISGFPEGSERIAGFSGHAEYASYLMIFLHRLGIHINEVFWTQAVKDPKETVNMTTIKKWYPDLLNEIVVTQPTVILTLGPTAISALAKEPIKVEKAIGKEFSFDLPNKQGTIPVIPLQHPRSFLDEKNIKKDTNEMWQSMKRIGDFI